MQTGVLRKAEEGEKAEKGSLRVPEDSIQNGSVQLLSALGLLYHLAVDHA